ncbi:MAG TPA: MFS transporter [Propionibacteriaceae bacterium]|nr:MFS transporter [Propionibacteriaceae bacterium]
MKVGALDARTAAAPFRSTAFRRYVAGQLPSVSCSWAQVVALAWVVVQLDPRSLGWVVACQFLPSLLLGPWFGAVVDRHDRRRALMLAEAGLGLVAVGYAAAAATGNLTLPVIYLLASVWGVLNALDTPARQSLVPLLVSPERAGSAAGLTGTVMVLGMTIGTAVGAVLIATVGVTATFAVNAASFFADVVILATIRGRPAPRVERAPRQIREGLGYVGSTPRLRAAMLALAIIATFAFTINVSVPLLARQSFAGGATLIGTLFTAVTAGCLVGTLAYAARGGYGPTTLTRTALGMAVAQLAIAVAPHPLLAMVGLAGVGFAWTYLIGAVVTMLQSARPELMGRVMSLFAVVLLGGTTIGAPLTTALVAIAGSRAPFALGVGAAVVAAATVRLRTGIRLKEYA